MILRLTGFMELSGRGVVACGLAGPDIEGLTDREVMDQYPQVVGVERARHGAPIKPLEAIGLLLKPLTSSRIEG